MFCFKEICKANILRPKKDEAYHYLLVDAGGGTIDMVAHRLTRKPSGEVSIEETHKAHGGPHGGFHVNDEFEKMLQNMFQLTTEELKGIKTKHPQQWTKLLATDFEAAKYSVDPKDTSGTFTLHFPTNLSTSIEKLKGKAVVKLVEEYRQHNLEWEEDNNELVIPFSTMKRLFLPIIDKIVAVIKEVLQKPECKEIDKIVLVGGFALSHLLFNEVESRFAPDKITVKRSSSPWLSVLKGAILFARHSLIHSRKMCQTLGIETWNKFKPGVHKESKKTQIEGIDYCKHVFAKFVEVNESVKVTNVIEYTFPPVAKYVQKTTINIYGSQSNVEYIDDDGCYLVGVMLVDLPEYESGDCRDIRVIMQVSGTEITVEAHTCTKSVESQPLPLHLDLIVDRYAIKEYDS